MKVEGRLKAAGLSRHPLKALNDPKQPLIRMSEVDREDLYARLAESIEAELDSERGGASDA